MRDDAKIGAWWMLLGAAAGSLVGLVVGGIGGRLLMLLLRHTSPGFVGSLSDDGFEIGVVSLKTLQLLGATMQIGALNGLGYVAARSFVPPRWRVPAWTLVAGALGAATVIHADGVDFLLTPQWLGVLGFVLVPTVGAAATAVLVERLAALRPWSRKPALLLGAAAVPAAIGVALALPVAAAALVLAQLRFLRTTARRFGRPVAALVLLVVAAAALADLARDIRGIF